MNQNSSKRLFIFSLAALGIVFGDIGTSPLYAIRECFHGEYSIAISHDNILGVLSLIFWSLNLIVSVKYLSFIFRADNNGEGGIIALLAQVQTYLKTRLRTKAFLISLGLFGAALLYGDSMITPAISVLSAVEGLTVAAPVLHPYVVPTTVIILALLFIFQSHGTTKIGVIFGPITFLWFVCIAILGIRGIWHAPEVLLSFNPYYAAKFFINNGKEGFLVLGAVFLVVTGTEALYADMGHFGTKPIRLVWFSIVLPGLLLNYFGQGALLLRNPEAVTHPFYSLAPSWALYPLIGLATCATIIASQAVISGAFSLTLQAIQLGYCPRLKIDHTSSEESGQIYISQINWMLMVTTIILVLGFQSSSKLAAAYGVAVTTTMLIASSLFYFVARSRFGWSMIQAGIPTLIFWVIDLSFFGANISKIAHGAWFPLAIAAVAYFLLKTWKKGRLLLAFRFRETSISFEEFFEKIKKNPPHRISGQAVFMTGNTNITPPAFLRNLEHNKIVHETTVFLTVQTEDVPRVKRENKVEVNKLQKGFYQIIARFGFFEEPNVPYVIALAKEKGLEINLDETSFFLGRERFFSRKKPGMSRLRERIFAFMSYNAQGATDFYHIPPKQVIELGAQVEL